LKGDSCSFEVFYVLADTECFTDDSKVNFGGIVGGDGGRWVGFADKIPDVSGLENEIKEAK
jgi:hypothetical protein